MTYVGGLHDDDIAANAAYEASQKKVESIRLCCDCKHIERWVSGGYGTRSWEYCIAPRALIREPVDGELVKPSCSNARAKGAVCGPDGALWELRPPEPEPAPRPDTWWNRMLYWIENGKRP